MGAIVRVYGRATPAGLERARARLAALPYPPERVSLVADGETGAVEAAFDAAAISPEIESATRGAIVEALYPRPLDPRIEELRARIEDVLARLDARLDRIEAKLFPG